MQEWMGGGIVYTRPDTIIRIIQQTKTSENVIYCKQVNIVEQASNRHDFPEMPPMILPIYIYIFDKVQYPTALQYIIGCIWCYPTVYSCYLWNIAAISNSFISHLLGLIPVPHWFHWVDFEHPMVSAGRWDPMTLAFFCLQSCTFLGVAWTLTELLCVRGPWGFPGVPRVHRGVLVETWWETTGVRQHGIEVMSARRRVKRRRRVMLLKFCYYWLIFKIYRTNVKILNILKDEYIFSSQEHQPSIPPFLGPDLYPHSLRRAGSPRTCLAGVAPAGAPGRWEIPSQWRLIAGKSSCKMLLIAVNGEYQWFNGFDIWF